jgi:hypothetical protein
VVATPPRPMRPLAVSQIGLAEHLVRHHVVTVPLGVPRENLIDPSFWSLVADRLRPSDKIDVHSADGTYYAELIVRQVSQGRPIAGVKGGALVHVLRYVEFEALGAKPRPSEFEVRYQGPAGRWCVVRLSDQTIMAQNLETREIAQQHLAAMATAPA